MSLPTTDLANVRVIESWIDRPFTEFDDTATKVYYLRCHCSEDDYTALVLGTANLTNATTAGVIATRYTDATARWVGDVDFKSSGGGYMTFIRLFANVPADHSDYTSSVVTLPDGYDDDNFLNLKFIGGDYMLSTRLDSTFSTDPASITINTPFRIIDVAPAADPVAVNYTEGSQTDPTTSEFYESSTERVSEATQVSKWMGDIYVGVTPYIIPDNISTPAAP